MLKLHGRCLSFTLRRLTANRCLFCLQTATIFVKACTANSGLQCLMLAFICNVLVRFNFFLFKYDAVGILVEIFQAHFFALKLGNLFHDKLAFAYELSFNIILGQFNSLLTCSKLLQVLHSRLITQKFGCHPIFPLLFSQFYLFLLHCNFQ